MENDSETQQIVARLTMQTVQRFKEGKQKSEIIAELESNGASREVAEAIVAKSEEIEGNDTKESKPKKKIKEKKSKAPKTKKK